MPARFTQIMRAAQQVGLTVEPPSSGSHFKVKRSGARTFTIPAHNGERTEISDKYIKSLCRNFGIDYAAFAALL